MDKDLKLVRDLLISVSARIMQVSDRKASVALGAASNVVIGTGFGAAVMGAVGSLGVASTGTAIASLAGAAKTSATLYAIGGVVGGGAAAGGLLIGAGALGAGFYGTRKIKQAVFGHARRETMAPNEEKIVLAVLALVQAIDELAEEGRTPSGKEKSLFSKLGIKPIVAELEAEIDLGTFDELKTYTRIRLRGHVNNLRRVQKRMEGSS